MATLNQLKAQVTDYCRLSLGDGMVDVDLDPEHYEMAINTALIKYRQLSSNSVEESYSFLTLQEDTNTYTLPQEIISVRTLYRASIGSTSSSTATQFEPFEAGFMNMYLLQAGLVGGLLNFELFAEYQKLAALMFGGYLNYMFDKVSKKLTIMRRQLAPGEAVLMWTYNYKPDVTIMSDYMAFPWIRDYALAQCKMMLGTAWSKFGSIVGPQGGTTLNGADMLQQGKDEIEKLVADVANYVEGGFPATFIIG